MSQPRSHTADATDFWRTLPTLLAALLAAVVSVDMLLTLQPAVLDDLSRGWLRVLAARAMPAPVTTVLAASVAVASIVIAAALLLLFSRAALVAPHATIAPAWVALWTLCVVRIPATLPLPMSLPMFTALSALLFVGASAALCSGTRIGTIVGWMLLVSPLGLLAGSYANVSRTSHTFSRDELLVIGGLVLSAVGVALLAFLRKPAQRPRQVEGLEGVDVVDELFTQIERAERSEARCAELERQLRVLKPPALGSLQRSTTTRIPR
jgi:hypothetical protein